MSLILKKLVMGPLHFYYSCPTTSNMFVDKGRVVLQILHWDNEWLISHPSILQCIFCLSQLGTGHSRCCYIASSMGAIKKLKKTNESHFGFLLILYYYINLIVKL